MRQQNVWVLATGYTAALVTDDEKRQAHFLAKLEALPITSEEAESIRRGMRRLVDAGGVDARGLERLEKATGIRGRAAP